MAASVMSVRAIAKEMGISHASALDCSRDDVMHSLGTGTSCVSEKK
jgi:hypothetical protein